MAVTPTIEYRTIDKSSWADGPWQSEPDKMQWGDEATGFPCLIVRGPSGALCGYVGVSSGHPLHGINYSDCVLGEACPKWVSADDHHWCDNSPESFLVAHGGLTFARGCGHSADPTTGVCHIPADGEPDDVWWFGFDCAHCDDLSPAYAKAFPGAFDGTYRDLAYVRQQVTSLAEQIASRASA